MIITGIIIWVVFALASLWVILTVAKKDITLGYLVVAFALGPLAYLILLVKLFTKYNEVTIWRAKHD